MSEARAKLYELRREIESSAGAQYIDRRYARSFSLNIFELNGRELIEVTDIVHDPQIGLALWFEQNRAENEQMHREVCRKVHNFVTAALSLVVHTRNFMRANYAGTSLLAAYNEKTQAEFAGDPLIQFVQGLRNYMLHKGPPPTQMQLSGTSNPDSGVLEFTPVVHFDTARLAADYEWPTAAREYLKAAGDHIQIGPMVKEYMSRVQTFQKWLDLELAQFHARDIDRLRELSKECQDLEAALKSTDLVT